MKKVTKVMLPILLVLLIILIGLIFLIGDDSEESTTTASDTTQVTEVKYGELISIVDNYDTNKTAVIKVKITSSYSNEATINQNYYNVAELITNNGFNKYEEIQYWAVADMSSGSEEKVVSFTLNSETIQGIYNESIVTNQIGNYADDLWVHTSLRDD